MRLTALLALLLLASAVGSWPETARGCPFCTAVSQTFSEEIATMGVVVLARLVEAPSVPAAATADPNAPLPKAQFRVERVLKGDDWVKPSAVVETLFFGDVDRERPYLIMGTAPPETMWGTPLALSPRGAEYVLKLLDLPADERRLEFFQEYLEDQDEMLARDAYDEFAKTPYTGVMALKDKMHHDRLVDWVKNIEIPASRRRLYFTMLGVCGQPADVPLLEELMQSPDRKVKAGLDALVACYLCLKGSEGLPLVEELFLKNPKAEYADTYAAIMAIRFHGTESTVIDRSQLVKALRYMLDRAELADLVIPDLARWQDWEVMPRLVRLFKEADEKSSWVRVPVVNYLRACPLPEAQQAIEELSKIDPEAVKRAQTFFPFDATGDGSKAVSQPEPDKSSAVPRPAVDSVASADEPVVPATATQPVAMPESSSPEPFDSALPAPAESPTAAASEPDTNVSPADTIAAEPSGTTVEPASHASNVAVAEPRPVDTATPLASRPAKRPTADAPAPWQPNLWFLWGVPLVAGVVLMGLFRLILGLPLVRGRSASRSAHA